MSVSLKLMQFNLENFFLYLDNYKSQNLEAMGEFEWQRLTRSTGRLKPLQKVKEIAQIILEESPDIVLVNEMGGAESCKSFCQLFLQNKYRSELIEGNSDRGIDIGYLIKSEFPYRSLLISHKDRPINFLYAHESESVRKSHYFSRDVSELRLFEKPDSHSPFLIVLGVHLKSKLDLLGVDPLGRSRRAAEVKSLLEIYSEILTETQNSIPIIVGGDFNGIASPINTEDEFAPIYELTDLQDTLHLIDYPVEDRFTQVNFDSLGRSRQIQIDYFLASKKYKSMINKELTKVLRFKNEWQIDRPLPTSVEQRSMLPSDHYPTILELEITF